MKRVKIALLSALLLSPCVLAQSEASINGTVGYVRMVQDDIKDYPFRGLGFDFGASGYIPLNDMAEFGGSAGIGYVSVSAEDEAKIELAISELDLYLIPRLRFGQWFAFGLQISIPISNDATIKAPGYEAQKLDTKKPETSFALLVEGIFERGSLSIGKILTGIDKPITAGLRLFIPPDSYFQIVPNISYAKGDAGSQLYLGIGFDYYFGP